MKKKANKKKNINISLDKLDQEQLKELRDRTGKTDRELLKLALQTLHRELCCPEPASLPFILAQPMQPITIPQQPIITKPNSIPETVEITWDTYRPTYTDAGIDEQITTSSTTIQ